MRDENHRPFGGIDLTHQRVEPVLLRRGVKFGLFDDTGRRHLVAPAQDPVTGQGLAIARYEQDVGL